MTIRILSRAFKAVCAIAGICTSSTAFCAIDNYAHTRYPIVTATGFTGAPKYLGIIDYWWGIEKALKDHGNDQFYVPLLSALATEDIRTAQMEKAIAKIMADTGATKINLIGHSQGGYTVRAYAALHPEQVASLTTIGGNNHGSRMADWGWAMQANIGTWAPQLRDNIVKLVEYVMWLQGKANGADLPQSALPTLYMSTTQGSLEFARNISDVGFNEDCNAQAATRASGVVVNAQGETVTYDFPIYSWVGSGAPRDRAKSGKNLWDPLDLTLTYKAIKNTFHDGPNDGVVSSCGAHLGEVIADNYYWDHLDEVNQTFGLTPNPDPRTVILAHANRLAQKGL